MPLQALPFNTPTRRGHAGSQNSRKPGTVTPPGEQGARCFGKGGVPPVMPLGVIEGLKGIPKPLTLGPLRSGQEVPTVTLPPRVVGVGLRFGGIHF